MSSDSGQVNDLTMVVLRNIQGQLARIEDDIAEVKDRLSAIEMANATTHQRLDRLEARLMLIEKRLDIRD
jgi:septal ring factor EnvC (AmiA/AmiB activator)